MYKFFLLLLTLPLISLAQYDKDEQLYLTADNKISNKKTPIKCVLNNELSRGYVKCYDGISGGNKVKQINQPVHMNEELQPKRFDAHINSTTGYEQYLIGDFKNGKPYNGFFRAEQKRVNEWLVFDFYKDGELTIQWYNNLYKTLSGKDNRLNFITLDSENTFVNHKLQNGMEIIPVEIKRGGAEVVRFVKNFQTDYIMLGLYAENYGEFVKIAPVKQGYLITSMQRSSAKVTFIPNGRKIEYFDSKNKLVRTQEFIQTDVLTAAGIDSKNISTYFQKGDKIYQEQEKNPAAKTDGERGNDYSRITEELARSFFNNDALNTATFVKLIQKNGSNGIRLGFHEFSDGKEFGFRYRKGDKEGTYSADYYEGGKISKSGQYSFKNKTPNQIAAFLETIK